MMEQITLAQLKDLFYDTLENCSSDLNKKDDDTVEYEVLENFDIGVHSFLHDDNLKKLLGNSLINNEIFHLASQLRYKVLAIPENKWEIQSIRNDEEWKEIIELSDAIIKLR